jgi:hypothetical protein
VTHHRLDQGRHLIRHGEIMGDGEGIDALRREFSLRLGEFIGFAGGDGDARAHLGQALRDLQSEAARTAGDEGHLAAELE